MVAQMAYLHALFNPPRECEGDCRCKNGKEQSPLAFYFPSNEPTCRAKKFGAQTARLPGPDGVTGGCCVLSWQFFILFFTQKLAQMSAVAEMHQEEPLHEEEEEEAGTGSTLISQLEGESAPMCTHGCPAVSHSHMCCLARPTSPEVSLFVSLSLPPPMASFSGLCRRHMVSTILFTVAASGCCQRQRHLPVWSASLFATWIGLSSFSRLKKDFRSLPTARFLSVLHSFVGHRPR